MDLLNTLLDLSEKKEISYTKKKLEKMSEEELEAVYAEYKRKELDEFNESMTDVVIFKFDEMMRKYELIKTDSQLGKKLQDKKLFRKDLKMVISYVSPYLPFIGILEGTVCIASEVIDKFAEDIKPSGNDIPDSRKDPENKNVQNSEENPDSGETQS